MKPKATLKIVVDVAMTLLFLMQMGYHIMDNRLQCGYRGMAKKFRFAL